MSKRSLIALALSALPVLAMAGGSHAGGHGDHARVTRTVEITMDDSMRFTPGEIQVKAGETVRFLIRNAGRLKHEMVIGTISDLKAHAAEMRKMPGMAHAEANMATVDPGATGNLVWEFDQVGIVDFACLIPGHMEAGMVGKIRVS